MSDPYSGLRSFAGAGLQIFNNYMQYNERQKMLDIQRQEKAAEVGLPPNASFTDIAKKTAELRNIQINENLRQIQEAKRQREQRDIVSDELINAVKVDPQLHLNELDPNMRSILIEARSAGVDVESLLKYAITPTPQINRNDYSIESLKDYDRLVDTGTDPIEAQKTLRRRVSTSERNLTNYEQKERAKEEVDKIFDEFENDGLYYGMSHLDLQDQLKTNSRLRNRIQNTKFVKSRGSFATTALDSRASVEPQVSTQKFNRLVSEAREVVNNILPEFMKAKSIEGEPSTWGEKTWTDFLQYIKPRSGETFRNVEELKRAVNTNIPTLASRYVNKAIGYMQQNISGNQVRKESLQLLIDDFVEKENIPSDLRSFVTDGINDYVNDRYDIDRSTIDQRLKKASDKLESFFQGLEQKDSNLYYDTPISNLFEDVYKIKFDEKFVRSEYSDSDGKLLINRVVNDLYPTIDEQIKENKLLSEQNIKAYESIGTRAFFELSALDYLYQTGNLENDAQVKKQLGKRFETLVSDYSTYKVIMNDLLNGTPEEREIGQLIQVLGEITALGGSVGDIKNKYVEQVIRSKNSYGYQF